MVRKIRWAGVMAIVALGLMVTGAQASISPCANPTCTGGPNYDIPVLGNGAAELAFVESVTGVDLDLFAKKDAGQPQQNIVADAANMTITETNSTTWHLEWHTTIWDVRFILVKDGAVGQPGSEHQGYSLFIVSNDQFRDGSGDVFLGGLAEGRGISHITVFGVQTGTSVPEPATLLLLGTGLLGTAVLGRRRLKK